MIQMARFSALGEDDGEGPSNSKRQRTSAEDSTHSDDHSPEEIAEDETNQEQEVERLHPEEEEEERQEESEEQEEGDESILSRRIRSHTPQRSNGEAHTPLAAITAPSREGSVSVFLTDPEVLDCSICFEPLSLPVFQCENGHVACSSCCAKLNNRCPSCCFPIGYNRCRAIEKVLESVQISCQNMKYGCKETVKCSEKRDHEKVCNYSPCSCPHTDCCFLASSEQLSRHICRKHPDSVRQFFYNIRSYFSMNAGDRFLVLREEDKGELFILRNRIVLLGNVVTVSRICSNSSKGELSYELIARNNDCSLTLLSSTENSPAQISSLCSKGFLLVPRCYIGTSLHLKLELRIWNKPNRTNLIFSAAK